MTDFDFGAAMKVNVKEKPKSHHYVIILIIVLVIAAAVSILLIAQQPGLTESGFGSGLPPPLPGEGGDQNAPGSGPQAEAPPTLPGFP